MRRVTLEEAKALADQWKAQREDVERMPNADYFRDASPHDLIRMWKTGKSTSGKKLTDREFGCLVERWVQVFDAFPPSNDEADVSEAVPLAKLPELPPDDTVVRPVEVVRLTGLSKSTINRMVSAGTFPPPLRIGERARGWLSRDLKAWRELLDEQRRRPRQ
ncbi:MAG: AlpA family phage regulatory protein [Hyphomicrobium sp.]|uniref:helix-turn-helix transcriptional regulator n=1 Tax=Hyphomicrobium sp. TaxID=82 RepID=UPI0039E461ED